MWVTLMGDRIQKCNDTERDLGVILKNQLNMSAECDVVAKRADIISGCISRGISSKSRKVVFPLYAALVRLLLIYCAEFLCPHFKKDAKICKKFRKELQKLFKFWKTNFIVRGLRRSIYLVYPRDC